MNLCVNEKFFNHLVKFLDSSLYYEIRGIEQMEVHWAHNSEVTSLVKDTLHEFQNLVKRERYREATTTA